MKSVLVVDSDPVMLRNLVGLLKSRGSYFHIMTAGDEAEALTPPTSLVAVVETVRCAPASTVADPGLTPVIAASADRGGAPTTTSTIMAANR